MFKREGCCLTCQKWDGIKNQCKVFIKPIGRDRPCTGWTDDPKWEEKLAMAVKKYNATKSW